MQRQRLIIIIGIILGLIAVALIWVYLDQQRRAIEAREKQKFEKLQENMVSVLVAKKDIPKDSDIEADSLEVKMTPKEYLQPKAVTSLDRVAGMKTLVAIAKGEQLSLSKLAWPRERLAKSESAGGTLAMATPVGKRAVTIAVDNVSALAGMVKGGDYVDIFILIPIPTANQAQDPKQAAQPAVVPLFQNIQVLAVGREIGRSAQSQESESRYAPSSPQQPDKSGGTSLITLALSPEEANIVTFVQEQGRFRLALRSPADSQIKPYQPMTWDLFFKSVLPAQPAEQKPQEAAEEKKAEEFVEVYRGLKKEMVPLSSK